VPSEANWVHITRRERTSLSSDGALNLAVHQIIVQFFVGLAIQFAAPQRAGAHPND
jgi:hypothetical protein